MATLNIFRIKYILLIPTIALLILGGCKNDGVSIPKPPTYLRHDFPIHSYKQFLSDCPYTFQISKSYIVKEVKNNTEKTCHKDIDLGPLNGVLHFSYIEMIEPLAKYVNFANDKVEEHKIKATGIDDFNIIRPKDNVYGTFFELKGDVASPFQFYLTDSTSKFISGVLYFNCQPNYDSLRPNLEYVKEDLVKLVNTFQWKK